MRAAYKTKEFLELVSRERVTYVIAVPTIYTLCVNDPNFDHYDLQIGASGVSEAPRCPRQQLSD